MVSDVLSQARRETVGADFPKNGNGWNIERQLKGLANCYGPLERQIEIFGHIAAVSQRPVLDQRLRMDEAVLKTQTIDERLERRTRRPQRPRHVDLPGSAGIRIFGRTNPRLDLAAAIVHRQNGNGNLGPKRSRPFRGKLLKTLLQG